MQSNSFKDKIPIIYKDFGDNLDVNPITKDLIVYQNFDDIANSIKNIVRTLKGERFWNPSLGSDVYSLLFENFSLSLAGDISNIVSTAIKNFEPRAILQQVLVNEDIDNNGIMIEIVFMPINSNYVVTINQLLKRDR